MDDSEIAALEQALSLERFARYLSWAAGDRRHAIALYTLNAQLSECLYIPMQMLEIALRNRIHTVMSKAALDHWYDEPRYQLSSSQAEQVAKAKNDLSYEGKDLAPGRVVAALTFGYWTAFFNTDSEDLWRHQLWKIVARSPGRPLRRKDFSVQLTPIRRLRNRIAHHEPILEWHLPRHYGNMLQLAEWLEPAAAGWCRAHCRFDDLYPLGGVVLARAHSARRRVAIMTDQTHLDELLQATVDPLSKALIEDFCSIARNPQIGTAEYAARLREIMEESLQYEVSSAPAGTVDP